MAKIKYLPELISMVGKDTDVSIAKKFNISHEAVTKFRAKNGIPRYRKVPKVIPEEALTLNVSSGKLAAFLNVSHSIVESQRKEYRLTTKRERLLATDGFFDDLLELSNRKLVRKYNASEDLIRNLKRSFWIQTSQNKLSKYEGVTYNKGLKCRKKWVAYYSLNGERKHIGTFATEIEAYNVRKIFLESLSND